MLIKWLVIQTFQNRLVRSLGSMIRVDVKEYLISKPFKEAYGIIEEMNTNNFQWPIDRMNPK